MRLPLIELPEGQISMAVHATNRADEEKLQQGLHRLHDEDPTLEMHYNPETHETIVSGLGERHLEVDMSKLKRKFGVTGRAVEAEDRLSRDDQGQGGRTGPTQKAVGRTRPVR